MSFTYATVSFGGAVTLPKSQQRLSLYLLFMYSESVYAATNMLLTKGQRASYDVAFEFVASLLTGFMLPHLSVAPLPY